MNGNSLKMNNPYSLLKGVLNDLGKDLYGYSFSEDCYVNDISIRINKKNKHYLLFYDSDEPNIMSFIYSYNTMKQFNSLPELMRYVLGFILIENISINVYELTKVKYLAVIYLKEHYAATTIQRKWKKVISDPECLACKRRLLMEFSELI